MYPGHWGPLVPDKPAVVMVGSGEIVTHGQLDDRSRRLANLFEEAGLRPGDHVAVLLENHPRYLEVAWAAMRSGLYLTTVNRYLTAGEAEYIVADSDAKVLVTSVAFGEIAEALDGTCPTCTFRLMIDGVVPGFRSYEGALEEASPAPRDDEVLGEFMLYSSGSTGRPKGVLKPLSGSPASAGPPFAQLLVMLFGFTEDSVYLCPAPMYHAAGLGFSLSTTALGGTAVIMERFDAREALRAIETHSVTHSQWVPTMFSRLLRLPAEERERFDLSSHQLVIHAAAPCPPEVKTQMLDWWGPIIHEYYGGTELNGVTYASPEAWLAHPGTVGTAVLGTIHICDDEGAEVPVGEPGTIYFELPAMNFEYYKNPGETVSAQHPTHDTWSTLNDIGRVDEDGFLYLLDRATFMIVSGGVNIYPQEIENVLVLHPKVEDVAVFGVPDPEMGEAVKAVVQLVDGVEAGPELAEELIAFTREHLAGFKCPRSVDFEAELPRLPTGKLYKVPLRERYWEDKASRIV